MDFYKYMSADTFFNHFYDNHKLKISKLSEFTDVYEPDTFINSFDIKSKIEEEAFRTKMEELRLSQKLILKILNMGPQFWSEIFNPNTKTPFAKAYREILIKNKNIDFLKLESEWKKCIADTIINIQEIFKFCEEHLIVLCLSEKENSQILYDLYGKHKGVMLEFDSKYITDIIKVEYGQNLRKNHFMDSIPTLIQLFLENKNSTKEIEIAQIFFKTYAFKNKDYDYEHEHRIIKDCSLLETDPQLSKLKETYLIDIGLPKSITLGYNFAKNDGFTAKIIAIKEFCKKYNIKLYQALKSDFDDEIMQRKEINID